MKNMFKEFTVDDNQVFELPDGYVVKMVVKLERNDFEAGTKLVVWLQEAMPEYIFVGGDDDEDEEEQEQGEGPDTTPEPDAPKGNEAAAPLSEEERIATFAKNGGQMLIIQNIIPPAPVAQKDEDSSVVKDVKQYLREQDSRRA